MRLVTNPLLQIRRVPLPGDARLLFPGPKRNLQHVVRLAEHVLGQPKTVKDLDGARLHAVGLADLERAGAALEDDKGDAEAGEPDGGAEAGGAGADDEDGGVCWFGHFFCVVMRTWDEWRGRRVIRRGRDGPYLSVDRCPIRSPGPWSRCAPGNCRRVGFRCSHPPGPHSLRWGRGLVPKREPSGELSWLRPAADVQRMGGAR